MSLTQDFRDTLRSRRFGCALLILCLVAVLALGAYKVARIWPHAAALWTRAGELRALAGTDPTSLLHPQRLPWAREQLEATHADLVAVRSEIGFLLPLLERLDWVPRFGGDIAAAPALLDLAIELCDAGWWGLLGIEPVWDALMRRDQPAEQSALEAALPPLVAAQPRFAQAAKAVARARPAMARLQSHELSAPLAHYKALLDDYWPLLEGAVLLAQDLPTLLGHERPISYLLLAQNSHELRPAGGFISGVGLLRISAGKIISVTFQDSYAVDVGCDLAQLPPAPRALREHMWAPALVFRDANWSPDFTASAATAASIYRLCQATEVDGVLAMDLDAVVALVGVLGSLQLQGYPAPVTAATFLQMVQEYWTNPLRSVDITDEQKDQWWLHRKDFMGDLLQAVLQRLTASPRSLDIGPLGMSLLKGLQTRHVLVTLLDPALNRGLAAAGWDGAARSVAGDYLMVVDANIGFRKVNPQIQQTVEYHVALRDGQAPRARLVLRYANGSGGSRECVAGSRYDASYGEMMQGCYWDYVRVYVPLGSRLLSVDGGDAPAEVSTEAGKSVFATLLVVAPGQTRQLVFQYELPPLSTSLAADGVGGGVYRLWVQKQPGTPAVPVRVTVAGDGWQFSPSRSSAGVNGAGAQAEFDLAADTRLAWVDAGASARRAVVPALALAGVGVMLIALGVTVALLSRRARLA